MGDDFTNYKTIKKDPNIKSVKSHVNMASEDFTYEHFPVVCPTCEGTGSIEEDTGHMVTFVPVKDERLRPAWTKVKIVALIVIIMVIGGCTTYFLYPRTVTIQVTAHEISAYDFHTASPWIEYSFTMNVTNQNFFPITLKHFTMQMLYVTVIVSSQTFPEDYHVGMRTVKEDLVKMNASYDAKNDVAKYIRRECYKNRNYVPQLMVSFAELSYWMHTEHIQSKDDYFFTDCDTMIFPLPIKTTTKPPTTKASSTQLPPRATTHWPTTGAPTTSLPTTGAPTTSLPTTGAPTTSLHTTDSPTTGSSKTKEPQAGSPTVEPGNTQHIVGVRFPNVTAPYREQGNEEH